MVIVDIDGIFSTFFDWYRLYLFPFLTNIFNFDLSRDGRGAVYPVFGTFLYIAIGLSLLYFIYDFLLAIFSNFRKRG